MRLEKFFQQQPVFTSEELVDYLKAHGTVGPRAPHPHLDYHKKTGRITAVRRGLYAVVPLGADSTSYRVDPFLVAAKLTKDSVLSHHTALELFGRAYTIQQQFVYLAARPVPPFTFQSHVFHGSKFPKVLSLSGKKFHAVSSHDRAGMEIRVTSLERTLVDLMDRPDLSGSWEEIWRSLESVEYFNLQTVIEYALLLGNSTTAAKVGFFLEQHREALMVEEKHLRPLRELRPKHPHYLNRSKRESGRLVPGWNLVVPEQVLERSWAEVA